MKEFKFIQDKYLVKFFVINSTLFKKNIYIGRVIYKRREKTREVEEEKNGATAMSDMYALFITWNVSSGPFRYAPKGHDYKGSSLCKNRAA